MDKSTLLDKIAQTEEDRILLARIFDKIAAGERKNIPAFTCFLTRREQLLAAQMLRGTLVTFFGGTEAAERCVCCYLPDYLEETVLHEADFSPICAVRAEYYEADDLSHRDFLGSLMGCGIKRETVGDIFVGRGQCDFLVTREILPYLLQNLTSAGRTKLHLRQIPLDEIAVPEQDVREIRATVCSLRLDSVIGAGFGLARGKAAAAIESGKVTLNDLPCQKADKTVAEGDKIVLRGMGKIQLQGIGGRTKKDRLGVIIRRFG